jgi:hypothetical protein
MKTQKFSALLAVVFTVICSGIVRADLTPSEIVSQFNGTNGWAFTATSLATPRTFTAVNSSHVPNLSAYASGTLNSFCVNSSIGTVVTTSGGVARLNYDATTGRTQNASGVALSVGGALLYQQYAAGELPDVGTVSALAMAIRDLNSVTSISSISWTTGYYAYLLTINVDKNYWIGNYNVNQYYEEIGNYAVFIMNIWTNGGTVAQDHLYVAGADYSGGSGDVPEPATLLLWTLGGVGALGINHYRKRSKIA